ncbi:UDP-3-O-acylglucosamine N-acyltransferase [Zhongshania aliphaticivorans]|uniref:UDP-3-O-acylglucosamine N-acyltransferase n=1 Tax=Zhongshania aliphaticivorans TaxID=1470434 RepID=A0A5S9NEU7_9GAMM|nr:UDP-3-O-(3-hydroxymyristoyl)glucosamine N-acyltransferase [Zhongshania aliphaticivorans]CAA0088726.1 UDP-3-O-acylglucosamine N-acyltransferase [Zhongshania aliphaticivorans]CAA0095002.1 UDP-3-O-acylglucosamine N-acyltransferase [Zhongshania aliphaticivorans]
MSMTQRSLMELADFLDAKLIGHPDHKITGIADLQSASASDLSFVNQESYLKYLADSSTGAVILCSDFADKYSGNKLIVANTYLAYAKVSALFETLSTLPVGIHPSAIIAASADIDPSAAIGPNCVIGAKARIGAGAKLYSGVSIGDRASISDNTLIHPNVTIYHGVSIGKNCVIHSGTVVGSDGFGFAPTQDGWQKIHQLGTVLIGDSVEIGSNCSIDRGALGDTVIHDNVIIDNLVHIAHNVSIGKRSAIAGCVGIAGSAKIGASCTVAGAVAINGHITIADNSHFHGGTIVTKGNAEPGVFASTPPMQDVKKWRRNSVRYTQLDEMSSKIRQLEKQLKSLLPNETSDK